MPIPDVNDPNILPIGIEVLANMPWIDETNVNDPVFREQFMYKDLDQWISGVAPMGSQPTYQERLNYNTANKQPAPIKKLVAQNDELIDSVRDEIPYALEESQNMGGLEASS